VAVRSIELPAADGTAIAATTEIAVVTAAADASLTTIEPGRNARIIEA
jgi:hypothetical protein